MYKFKGTIKHIGNVQTFGDKGFSKQDLVLVESDAKYPQTVKFELTKDNTKLLDKHKTGEEVEVKFNVRGREYNGNYYVSLEAYNIFPLSAPAKQPKTILENEYSKEEWPPF